MDKPVCLSVLTLNHAWSPKDVSRETFGILSTCRVALLMLKQQSLKAVLITFFAANLSRLLNCVSLAYYID